MIEMIGTCYIRNNPLKRNGIGDSWLVGEKPRFLLLGVAENHVNSVGIPTCIEATCNSNCSGDLKSNE